jgi:serine/threonine protein kinase/Tol biopolymer transport system component
MTPSPMSFQPGTRFGAYEILAPLGAGGMGEVYRARDTKLDRDVAIKVLPLQLAESPTALARFEREAKAVAALSHPNILSIFDFGTQAGTAYAVMELLEGATLREKLAAPIPARKAIDYAVQMARGLAAAHGKGIVHRDLKPENLFVTADGRLKILDFGLARQTIGFAGADATVSPTLERHTDPGTVLGTVGYMSPEQVRGETGDHRSDLFSFGCVLYELLSGRRAFQRGTAAETMTAILREEPPELTAAPTSAIAPGLARVVEHCLEKHPEQRFQSASDVAFALEALSGPSTSSAPALSSPAPRVRRSVALIAAAASIVVAAAASFYAGRSTAPVDRHVSFTPLTFQPQTIFRALFAPDGKTLVFSAALTGVDVELFTIDPEFPEARRLGLRQTQLLSVSSKSELAVLTHATFIGHRIFEGTLARVPLGGGAPREIVEHVREADWSPDGDSLAIVREVNGRDRLEFPAGTVLFETSGNVTDLRVSPSGDRVAFFEHPIKLDDRGSVAVVGRNGAKTTLSGSAEYWGLEGLAWSRDGREVLYSGGQGYAQFKVFAATLDGHVRQALESAGGLTLFDIGPKGQWLASRDDVMSAAMVRPPGAKEDVDLSWLDFSIPAALSRDGTTLIFSEGGGATGANYAVGLRKTDGSPVVRLGEGTAQDLSADGKWVLSAVPGTPQRLMVYPTGAGESRALERGSIEQYTSARWFPDGKRIAVCGSESGKAVRCFVQDVAGGSPRPATPENTNLAMVSPDGGSLLVQKGSDTREIYRLEGGPTLPIGEITKADQVVRWDSANTLILATVTTPVRLERFRLDTRQRELLRTIAPGSPVGVNGLFSLVVADDPNVYAYGLFRQLSRLFLIQGAK